MPNSLLISASSSANSESVPGLLWTKVIIIVLVCQQKLVGQHKIHANHDRAQWKKIRKQFL